MKTGKLIACKRDGSSRQVEVTLTKEKIVISDIEIPIDIPDKTPPHFLEAYTKDPGMPELAVENPSSSVSSTMPTSPDNKEREVTIKRQPGGGLGISVKGGAEHGIPVLISRVFSGKPVQYRQTEQLYPGDAILSVNGKSVANLSHDEVVNILRSCGNDVTLRVRMFDGASRLLRNAEATAANSNSPSENLSKNGINKSDNSPTATNKISDEDLPASVRLPINSKMSENIITPEQKFDSPTASPAAKVEGSITKTPGTTARDISIPLALCRIECITTTSNDMASDHSFQVCGCDGISSDVLKCKNKDEQNDWIRSISRAIHLENAEFSKICKMKTDVHLLGWTKESKQDIKDGVFRFLVVEDDAIVVYDQPPYCLDGTLKSIQYVNKFVLYESLCGYAKTENTTEACQMAVQHEDYPIIYYSFITEEELSRLVTAVHDFCNKAVYRIKTKSYTCTWKGMECLFSIDFNKGFLLQDPTQQNLHWKYKFSELKSSSDDGNKCVQFTFYSRERNLLEKQEMFSEQAYRLLFCVHSFLAAKLALLDKGFIQNVLNRPIVAREQL